MLAPLWILSSFHQCRADSRPMFLRIEIFTVIFRVMQANVLRCLQSRDIGRPVIAAIEIQMMAMWPGYLIVDFVPEIPFIGQAMRGAEVPVDRLIHFLVAAKHIP